MTAPKSRDRAGVQCQKDLLPRLVINESSIGAGGSVSKDLEPRSLINVDELAVTIRVTYPVGMTAGVTVNLYSTPDGANWDTDVYTTFAPSFAANSTKQKTFLVEVCVKNLRIEVVNGDVANVTGAVKVWVQKKRG